jgi:hypothetical protein
MSDEVGNEETEPSSLAALLSEHWIAVMDKLPEEWEIVLVYIEEGSVTMGWYMADGWQLVDTPWAESYGPDTEVLYWMPVPAHPMET